MPLKPKFQKMLSELVSKHGKKKGAETFWATMEKRDINPEQKAYFFYGSELKSLDDDSVEGYIATGDQDLINDIITPNCMMDMLAQLKDRVVKVDVEHEAFKGKDSLEKELNKTIIPVAKITNAVLEAKGIKVKTDFNKHHSRVDEVKGSIKDKFLDAFSIAYVPVEVSYEQKGDEKIRKLEKVNLLNVAFTGNPINPEAGFSDVMIKSITEEFGGIAMTDEKKEAEKKAAEEKAALEKKAKEEESGDKPPAEGDAPKDEAEKVSKAEVKALTESHDAMKKEIAELKAQKSDKKEAEKKSGEERLKALEEKAKKTEEFLSSPQFKGKSEAMDAELKKAEIEAKAKKGPIDAIV